MYGIHDIINTRGKEICESIGSFIIASNDNTNPHSTINRQEHLKLLSTIKKVDQLFRVVKLVLPDKLDKESRNTINGGCYRFIREAPKIPEKPEPKTIIKTIPELLEEVFEDVNTGLRSVSAQIELMMTPPVQEASDKSTTTEPLLNTSSEKKQYTNEYCARLANKIKEGKFTVLSAQSKAQSQQSQVT